MEILYASEKEYLQSDAFKEDRLYWEKLIQNSGDHIKYYNIREKNVNSKKREYDKGSISLFIEQHGSSPLNFFGSVFAFYLSRINRQPGILLQTAVSSGTKERAERKTLLKIDVSGEKDFTKLMEEFSRSIAEAAEHTVVGIETYLSEKSSCYSAYDLSGEKESIGAGDEEDALQLLIFDDRLELRYQSELYSDVFIDRMLKNIEAAVEDILRDPQKKLTDVDIISREEREILESLCRGKLIEVDEEQTVSLAFRKTAHSYPEVIAVDDGVDQISYGEMERRTNSAADDLHRNHGIGPKDRVALMLPRNYHFPEMVLALNKIGAAYVPVEPLFPTNRIRHMLEIAGIKKMITTRKLAENKDLDVELIFLDELVFDRNVEVDILCGPEDLFTILFTSGTTGLPKGVRFSNKQYFYGVNAYQESFHMSVGDIMGSFFSFSFIASALMFSAVYPGATIRLFNEEEQKNGLLLTKAFKEKRFNNVMLPPAVGIPIYENDELNLQYLMLAGAKLSELGLRERPTRLVNFYGTTEIGCAVTRVYSGDELRKGYFPLGRPTPNTWVYILDREGHRMPIGVPGEICVAGGMVSGGYLNDPEMTAQHFVDNPFADSPINQKMYRTGDIGYYDANGEIQILGREDDQLSVRGFRIESDEILRIMKGFSEISDIYLDVDEDNLVAYYVAREGGSADYEQLTLSVMQELKKELPYYMVPSMIIRLDKIPLNINGKIDRAKLRSKAGRKEDVPVDDEVLRQVILAFKEVLKQNVVRQDDDFIFLGGNSLSAMKLQIAMKEKLQVHFSANELMGLSTPKEIADYIKANPHVYSEPEEGNFSFDTPCPMTESQLNVFLDECAHDMETAYNNPFRIRFRDGGKTDPEKIEEAIKKLLSVFPILKAHVRNEEGTISLSFDGEPEIVKGQPEDMASFVRPFNLGRNLSRFLILEEGDSTVLCMDFHHLIFDGTSAAVLMRGFLSILGGEASLPVDKGILRAAAYEQLVISEKGTKARAFFDGMLSDRDEVHGLIPSLNGVETFGDYTKKLDVDVEKLGAFLKQHAITHNQFFAGVFAYTLSGFSGSEKVLFHLIEDGRGQIDLSGAVGMFVKTVPVLFDCKNRDVDSYLQYAHQLINSVMKYDMYPYRILAKEYDLNADIQFQYDHDIYREADRRGGTLYDIEEMKHTPSGDLSFDIRNEGNGGLLVRVQYTSLYSEDFIERFVEAYQAILSGMMTAEKTADINYVSENDLIRMNALNRTETREEIRDILDVFNDNLSQYPHRRLVEYKETSYTFAKSAFIANSIREKLSSLGVEPEDRVGFLVPRSELYLLSVLGIVSLGCAYVPLDDRLPDERIGFMLRDTDSRVLIVSDDTEERAKGLEIPGLKMLNISNILKEKIGTLEHLPVEYGKLVAILYTSGSTGVPKGVKVTRKSISCFAPNYARLMELRPEDKCGAYAAIGFDVSMEDMFSCFYSGACLSVIPYDVRLNIYELNEYMIRHGITYAEITTAIAKQFISNIRETSLRVLMTGGEKLGEVSEVGEYRLVDSYGPTEACVSATAMDFRKKIDPCSVGPVLDHVRAYVLDSEKRRVPIGAVGELFLSGPQLADGYLNREEETARAFLPNPFEQEEDYNRMYATGDVARMLPDGTYDIVGRRDGQVKIRGNRIELMEVEAMIRKMDHIKDVTVQVKQTSGQNKELVAYVVSDDLDQETLEKVIPEYLSGRGPAYMVPSFVIKMDSIPLNVNGKVDRRALPEVDPGANKAEYAAPKTKLETRIVQGFEQVFEQEGLGVNDDFIRLGGDSLTAVKLISILEDTGVSVGDILGLRTPAAIAAGAHKRSFDADVYTVESGCPLSNTQQYIYNDIVRNEKYDSYLIPSLITIPGKRTNEEIRSAIEQIYKAYPILTTRIGSKEGVDYLVQGGEPEILTGSYNLASVVSRLTATFDMKKYLTRHMIVRLFGKCYLVSLFHHIIFDFVSENVFRDSLLHVLDGGTIDHVDDTYLKLSAFNQQMFDSQEFQETERKMRKIYQRIYV